MKVAVTETGERGAKQDLMRRGFGNFEVLNRQRLVRLVHYGGSHVFSPLVILLTFYGNPNCLPDRAYGQGAGLACFSSA